MLFCWGSPFFFAAFLLLLHTLAAAAFLRYLLRLLWLAAAAFLRYLLILAGAKLTLFAAAAAETGCCCFSVLAAGLMLCFLPRCEFEHLGLLKMHLQPI